ncbi:hypothetical protein [Acinetobacter bereziniae]|uniref:hypothetical protein n=1 Tax=Acinetobacter bereziniae TaxID=106648 RepID=UPI003009DE8F
MKDNRIYPHHKVRAVADQIKPNIVRVDASNENNSEEEFPIKMDDQQHQALVFVQKKASFKTKEVKRLPNMAGADPVIPRNAPYAKVQAFIDYALADKNVWKYSKEELATEKLFNLYWNERGSDSLLGKFLVKVLIFIESLERGKNITVIWLKNNDPEASVDKHNLTLIGKRYFLLLNEFYNSGYVQNLNRSENQHKFFNLLNYFAPFGRNHSLWAMLDFKNEQAIQLNRGVLALRKAWFVYKTEYSKNLENIHYIKNLSKNQVFDKDRLIFRFKLKSYQLQYDVRLLSSTFTELMKRLKGKYRLSNDIKYIKYTNEIYSKKYLDVLFFIEPNEKFESIQEIINSLQDHWLRAIDYVLKNDTKDIITTTADVDAELQELMKTEELFQTEYLYIDKTDKTKIKKVIDVLIPYFISQAIFFPIKSPIPKTRQLILVGFEKKYHNSVKSKIEESRNSLTLA